MRRAEIHPGGSGDDGVARRDLDAALGASDLAVKYYVLPPGERISGLHAHAHQEEVFVVLEGATTVETLSGTVDVAAGEAVRFAPGEFQSVTNPADEPALVLALGAPRGSSEFRVPVACPACGHGVAAVAFEDGTERLVCPECGHEREAACPDCGGERRAVLGEDGRPVSRCRDCGATTRPG
jgi:uncharacterized cupin superfamily protein/Zn ribbon nucleic-acid-binding protein